MRRAEMLAFFFVVAAVVSMLSADCAAEVTLQDAAAMAAAEALRLGYPLDRMESGMDEGNTRWHRYLRRLGVGADAFPGLSEALAGKEYWAIYYYMKQPPKGQGVILGGDLFVFVDRQNGQILGVVRGQ